MYTKEHILDIIQYAILPGQQMYIWQFVDRHVETVRPFH